MCICNAADDRTICKECFHSKDHDRISDKLHVEYCGGKKGRKCIDHEIKVITVKCKDNGLKQQ